MRTTSPKKIGIVLVLALIVVIWGLWFVGGKSTPPKSVDTDDSVELITFERKFQPDTDGDGLKDWEEALWKTGVNNVDTDGDGTSDGDEVTVGRDPTIAGPNDEITNIDKRLRSIARTATLQKGAPLLDPSKQDLGITDTYNLLDLDIVDSPNFGFIKGYGLALGDLLGIYSDFEQSNVMVITLTALETGDRDVVSELTAERNRHVSLIRALLVVQVPASAGGLHAELINSLASISESVFTMEQIFDEPILALEAVELYPERYFRLLDTFEAVNTYFFERNILFDESEQTKISY